MRYFLFLFFLSIYLISGCKRESELQRICRKIRETPQREFPRAGDPKWELIDELTKSRDRDMADSVQAVFRHIDTTVPGYSNYQYTLLSSLVQPESKNALEKLAELHRDERFDDPSTNQVLTHFFTDERLWGDLLASYITKQNLVNYRKVLKNIPVMYPGLAQALGKHRFADDEILDLTAQGIKCRVLDSLNLESSLPFFLGVRRANLGSEAINSLLTILELFKNRPEVNPVLKEMRPLPTSP